MFCGALEPEESLLVVLGDPFAALIKNPKIELGTGDALLGGALLDVALRVLDDDADGRLGERPPRVR